MVGNAYSYTIPSKYFPRYKIMGNRKNLLTENFDPNVYTFQYSVNLEAPAGKKISYLSAPSFSNYIEKINGRQITVEEPMTDLPPSRDIQIFYKTTNMMLTPNMYIEKDEDFDTVALGATFAPTFEKSQKQPQLYRKIVEDDQPNKMSVNGKDFHFVFIIDRSGSMQG